jgi:hypothetical protein
MIPHSGKSGSGSIQKSQVAAGQHAKKTECTPPTHPKEWWVVEINAQELKCSTHEQAREAVKKLLDCGLWFINLRWKTE